jgi:hypothetical protein
MQAVNIDDDPARSHLKEQFLLSATHLAEQKHREAVTEIEVRTAKQQSELLSYGFGRAHLCRRWW